MKKKLFAWVALGSLCLVSLAGCEKENTPTEAPASTESKEELTPVTLNEVAHSIFYAPQYVAIENGYFEEEGIDLTLVTGFGADKTMTAVLSGEADIGFMGAEASVYAYQEGANDPVVNFAQLTQRAGNFLVAREEMPGFTWQDLKGSDVLGGRKGGMPEMVFEYILKQNGIDPENDLNIDQSIDFGSTAAAFSGGQGDFTVEFEPGATSLEAEGKGHEMCIRDSISGDGCIFRFSRDLVNLVNIDNSILGTLDVVIRSLDNFQKYILHVLAHITCLGQCGRVRYGKWYIQKLRQRLGQ